MDEQIEISVRFSLFVMFRFRDSLLAHTPLVSFKRRESGKFLIVVKMSESETPLFKDVASFKTPVGSNSIALVIKFLDRSSSIFPLLKRASLKRRWTMEWRIHCGREETFLPLIFNEFSPCGKQKRQVSKEEEIGKSELEKLENLFRREVGTRVNGFEIRGRVCGMLKSIGV